MYERTSLLEHVKIKMLGNIDQVLNLYNSNNKFKNESSIKTEGKEVYFKSVSINTENGVIYTNESVLVKCIFVKINLKKQQKVHLCIAVQDNLGERIFSVIDDQALEPQKETKISLRIPDNLDLTPSNYSMLFQVYVPPGTIMFHELSEVIPFTITDHGTNFSGYSNYGKVFMHLKMQIIHENINSKDEN